MQGLIEGRRIIMAGAMLIEAGSPATLDSGTGYTLSITWGEDIHAGMDPSLIELQLPIRQSDDTIFLTSAHSFQGEATEIQWALDRLDETLRRFTFTVLAGWPPHMDN